jgi:hypothetical protein
MTGNPEQYQEIVDSVKGAELRTGADGRPYIYWPGGPTDGYIADAELLASEHNRPGSLQAALQELNAVEAEVKSRQ